jgi:hypothetical protein
MSKSSANIFVRAGRTSRTRRGLALAAAAGLTVGLSLLASPASAFNGGTTFELDGNAQTATTHDWDQVCAQYVAAFGAQAIDPNAPSTATAADVCSTAVGASASAVGFGTELNRAATIFTGGGSKDPINIPSWKWKDGAGGLPDKDNLQHAFAARYTTSTSDILTFGSDRIDNSGDAQQGFWFFQNKVGLNADGTFSGVHKDGDLLILSDFSIGGSVSTINVYKWNSGALSFLEGGTAAKCPSDSSLAFCGIVNPGDATAPWTFLDKSGTPDNGYLNGEFYEGGINLADQKINLGGECFASFASETRSSTSTTATLKDFVLGGFGDCGSSTVTTPQDSGGTTIGTDGISIGTGSVQVKDSAEVKASGSSTIKPTGTVSFSLCGPLADPAATCTTGGATVGTAKALSGTDNPATVVSDLATVTSAGRYCFRANYSGDTAKGIPESSDSSTGECFVVNPVKPTLTTSAGDDVVLGNPVTDTATLSGTANQPGSGGGGVGGVINPTTAGAAADGTITFSLYGPSDTGCGAFFGTVTPATTVSGDRTGTLHYGPVSLTPTAVGTYHWVASYSGDLPNTLGADDNALCDQSRENVIVTSVASSLTSAQSFIPNDSATVSAPEGGNLAGSVTFELFGSADCGVVGHDAALLTVLDVAVNGASPVTVKTSNTTALVLTAGTPLSWQLTYTSNNSAQRPIPATCLETSSLTIDNGGTVSSP